MDKEKMITYARALSLGGINASPTAVELILGIFKLVDEKGDDISLKDVTELAKSIAPLEEDQPKADA